MRNRTDKTSILAMSAAAALLAAPLVGFAQAPAPAAGAPAQIGSIRANSQLLHIDPALVEAGRARIAKMDLERIKAGQAGLKVDPPFKVIGNTYSIGTNSSTSWSRRPTTSKR